MTTNVNAVKQDIADAKRKLEEAQKKLIELESRESKGSQKKVWRPTECDLGYSIHGGGYIRESYKKSANDYYETGA